MSPSVQGVLQHCKVFMKTGHLRSDPVLYVLPPTLAGRSAFAVNRGEEGLVMDARRGQPKDIVGMLTTPKEELLLRGTARMGSSDTIRLVLDADALRLGFKFLRIVQTLHRQQPLHFNGGLVLHTAVTRNSLTDIAFQHIMSRGWECIGYHFVILPDGTVVMACPLQYKGSHTYGYNDSIGVCFARNLDREDLTHAEVAAYHQVEQYLSLMNLRAEHVFGHNTAALEVVRAKLQELERDEVVREKAAQCRLIVEAVQQERHADRIFFKRDMQYRLRPVYEFFKTLDATHRAKARVGDRDITQYLDELKDCPGSRFRFGALL